MKAEYYPEYHNVKTWFERFFFQPYIIDYYLQAMSPYFRFPGTPVKFPDNSGEKNL